MGKRPLGIGGPTFDPGGLAPIPSRFRTPRMPGRGQNGEGRIRAHLRPAPPYWQLELGKEEARRNERNFWCRVTYLVEIGRNDFDLAIQAACGVRAK